MAIRPIRTLGDPVLRIQSAKVTKIDNSLMILIEDMLETMYEAPGVGLAAPQIGVSKQVVVLDIGEGPICLINPEVIAVEGQEEDQEGCLSVPGRQRIVPRATKIIIRALNEKGEKKVHEFDDFLARVVQHEIDHLRGRLITDIGREAPKEEV